MLESRSKSRKALTSFLLCLRFSGTRTSSALAATCSPRCRRLPVFLPDRFPGLSRCLLQSRLPYSNLLGCRRLRRRPLEVGGLQTAGRLPQSLQVIKLARLFRENVDHKVHIVQQYPLGLFIALDARG